MSKKAPKVFTAGSLRDLKWKLGVAVASSACAELNAPYVHLRFIVDNIITNEPEEHSVELSIPEFQAFYSQFQEMATTMDSL